MAAPDCPLVPDRERMGSVLDQSQASPEQSKTRFEPRDVPPLLPFWLACLIGGFVALVLIGITLGFPLADRQEYRGPMQALPPAPRLQVAPIAERQRYDAAKRQELETAPLPLNAAMQATAKQGWGPPK
jgi:hypothetical protein